MCSSNGHWLAPQLLNTLHFAVRTLSNPSQPIACIYSMSVHHLQLINHRIFCGQSMHAFTPLTFSIMDPLNAIHATQPRPKQQPALPLCTSTALSTMMSLKATKATIAYTSAIVHMALVSGALMANPCFPMSIDVTLTMKSSILTPWTPMSLVNHTCTDTFQSFQCHLVGTHTPCRNSCAQHITPHYQMSATSLGLIPVSLKVSAISSLQHQVRCTLSRQPSTRRIAACLQRLRTYNRFFP